MEEKNNKYQTIRGDNAFGEMLKKQNINPETINIVMNKLQETEADSHNIIFVVTDNDVTITGVHVLRSALNGLDGPIIFKDSVENSLTAAFARDYIEEKINKADEVGEKTGLGSIGADQLWINELERLVETARSVAASTAPIEWDDLLKEGE